MGIESSQREDIVALTDTAKHVRAGPWLESDSIAVIALANADVCAAVRKESPGTCARACRPICSFAVRPVRE